MSSPSPESTDVLPARTSLWSEIAHALKGEQYDYTKESLNRATVLLAVPMVLEMLMESLFAVVDVFWVSRLGRDAVAVIGLTEAVMSLIYAIAIGMSVAATAFVARRIGENDPERAAQSAAQIVLLGVTTSGALGVVGAYLADDVLGLMGASPAILDMGTNFARLMLGGNITVFMTYLINAIFRGAGDPVLAMRTLWLANGVNIILGPCFIFGWGPFPEMGVIGAAVATTIGRGVGVLYQLWHLARHNSRVRLQRHHFRPAFDVLKGIVNTSGNGILQQLITTTSWIGLFKILALFGSAAIAGYTIAIRIVLFALMPAWGLANAGATLVGQNLGAQRTDRAEAAIRIASRFNMVVLGVVGAAFVIFAYPLVRLFTSDPQTLTYGARALWILSLAFPFYAGGLCMEAAFNGSGDTWTPTRLNFFCYWLGQVPLAWILSETADLGAYGVFIAVPISFCVLAVWSWLLFRRGTWKLQRV